jgi:hypothetical protein
LFATLSGLAKSRRRAGQQVKQWCGWKSRAGRNGNGRTRPGVSKGSDCATKTRAKPTGTPSQCGECVLTVNPRFSNCKGRHYSQSCSPRAFKRPYCIYPMTVTCALKGTSDHFHPFERCFRLMMCSTIDRSNRCPSESRARDVSNVASHGGGDLFVLASAANHPAGSSETLAVPSGFSH